jgi:hypothetical protein
MIGGRASMPSRPRAPLTQKIGVYFPPGGYEATVALSLYHLARWLAWQLGEAEQPAPERPASITVFSSSQPAPS